MRLFQDILLVLALAAIFAPLILAWFFWQWAESRHRTRHRETRPARAAEVGTR
jgi:CHASE3 domain sensor protein